MHAFPKSLHFNQDRQDSSWIFLRITKSTHFHIYFRVDWNAVIWEMCACSAMCNSLWPHEVIVHQAPLFMQFSRQEYWNGSLFPPPGYFPNQGIKPTTHVSCTSRWILFYHWATCDLGKWNYNTKKSNPIHEYKISLDLFN